VSGDAELATATAAVAEGSIRGHRWEVVCATSEVTLDRGVTALIDGAEVAIFLLGNGDLFAIDDRDPFSGASVLSRGLVGDVSGEPTVASPVYKQRFSLRSGRCLDDDSIAVRTWTARIRAGRIEVAVL